MTDRWMSYTVWYASDYGWSITPLHPSPHRAEETSSDPVERQLGYVAFKERSEASSNPERIREWTGCTDALLGVVTGPESDLIALEMPTGPPVTRGAEFFEQAVGSLPDTATVLHGGRKYLLYRYPDECASLPALTRHDDLVLHGDESLIPVPEGPSGSPFEWDIWAPNEVAPAPTELLRFFGHAGGDTLPGDAAPAPGPEPSEEAPEPAVSLSAGSPSTPSRSSSRPGSSGLFRSGDALCPPSEPDDTFLGLPWLLQDGLTLLTGRSKTAGKSTWTTNLAAHVVDGRRFLEYPTTSAPVVFLSDQSPNGFARLLQHIGVGDRDALSRLHVLHPKDVADRHWRFVIDHAYEYAREVNARLVVIDSLDQYVHIKAGSYPADDEEIAHLLTGEAPHGVSVLAVTSLEGVTPSEPMGETIDRLGFLSRVADLVVRMDPVETPSRPTLRRLRSLGRAGKVPSSLWCELTQGRYERVRKGNVDRSFSMENVRLPIPSSLRNGRQRVPKN